MSKLLEFAKHVLSEQQEMGKKGDSEYIRMAEEAIAEHEEDGKRKRKRVMPYVLCTGFDCMATMSENKAIYHEGKPLCRNCWKKLVNAFTEGYR